MLKNFVHQIDTMNTVGGGTTATRVDVLKEVDRLVIEVNAPTVHSDSFNIYLRGNQLIVYTVLNDTEAMGELENRAARHTTPMFNRMFDVPPHVDREQIDAIFEDGYLRVILPFSEGESAEVKRIDIREY
ncbi:MAG: Hsp20 family protein [Tunicatimonas sp.]|uniref:Hsp20/alpha crystallin family protein n=1 Tax=Tunicatimonas sp. TaxID=1940096 RepID=UPI003C75C13A